MLLGYFSEFSCHAGWRTQELKTLLLADRIMKLVIFDCLLSCSLYWWLRYSLGHIWNPSKFGYIPQWGECSWSVHYWRLYLIRYYTLKVVKGFPQSWGYLCEWPIVTRKTHFWGLSIFGRTHWTQFCAGWMPLLTFEHGHSDNGNPLSVSVQEILYRGGHLDHDHTVWLYESFVVHHYYGKLRLANAILLISPSGGSPMFRLFVAVNRTNNHAVILLGF